MQIGAANLVDPEVSVKVVEGLRSYCLENGVSHISELVGILECIKTFIDAKTFGIST
ncbi:MAG: hypothetical protein P8X68_12120 [Desulfobacterales bacterium]